MLNFKGMREQRSHRGWGEVGLDFKENRASIILGHKSVILQKQNKWLFSGHFIRLSTVSYGFDNTIFCC